MGELVWGGGGWTRPEGEGEGEGRGGSGSPRPSTREPSGAHPAARACRRASPAVRGANGVPSGNVAVSPGGGQEGRRRHVRVMGDKEGASEVI